ncbi:MAG: RNA polymerase sigma factor SigZ [Nitrospiraceae bacterium]
MNVHGGAAIMTIKAEELWQLVHDGLRAFIAKRVRDQAQVDDILQEVFLRVHRRIGGLKDPRRVVSWVYQITRHAIVDYYRQPGRQHEIPVGLSSDIEESGLPATIQQLGRDGDAQALRVELAGCLRPMIQRLSPDYREAITLVELEGLTRQTAARRMGLSLSGMKARVQRGRKQLKQMLDECCLIQLDRRGGLLDYKVHPGGCNPCKPSESTVSR